MNIQIFSGQLPRNIPVGNLWLATSPTGREGVNRYNQALFIWTPKTRIPAIRHKTGRNRFLPICFFGHRPKRFWNNEKI